jgi:hypothetical protein
MVSDEIGKRKVIILKDAILKEARFVTGIKEYA